MAVHPKNKFDPKNATDISQLSKAVGYSRKCLQVFRQNRLDLVRQWVGRHYSDNGAPDKVPINLLELSMNIYLQRLVANAPAVNISTDYKQLKEISVRFEMASNQLIKEIDLGKTLELGVTGAMLCMGAVKVGLNRTKVEIGGYLHDSGQPFADPVSLDNWVHDMTVDRPENGQYQGDFYFLTKDDAHALFPENVHKKLTPYMDDRPTEERDHNISEGEETQREEFRETVRLLDLWLPKQNLILQCQSSEDDNDPIEDVLKVIEWEGPERGPYHPLGFQWIENNTMPLAPAMHWKDLHTLSNKLFRKLGRQAEREKTLVGVRAGKEADGNRMVEASDGDMITVDDPKNIAEIKTGGISGESMAFFLATKDLFTYFAGNLDMLGGLGPQSETLGQDQLLSASASMRIQKMQKSTLSWTKRIVEDLGFYLWNDPYINMPQTKRVKGFPDVSVTVPFGPAERESDFMQYNLKVEPYSMQHQTPEAKLQGLRTIFTEFIAPMVPMMQQQGIDIDFEALFRNIAKLGNIPELNDILVYSNPRNQQQPVGQMPAKAAVTTRNYTRRSIPGATNPGKSKAMQQAFLGKSPQASEMAATMRPTG